MTTWAWGQIVSTDLTLQRHASLYCQCHRQMVALCADRQVLDQYQELHASDLLALQYWTTMLGGTGMIPSLGSGP